MIVKCDVRAVCCRYYPDAIPLMGGEQVAAREFLNNHMGILGTVRTETWAVGSKVRSSNQHVHYVGPRDMEMRCIVLCLVTYYIGIVFIS